MTTKKQESVTAEAIPMAYEVGQVIVRRFSKFDGWGAEYDPAGGYRIVYTPDPDNPPKRCGRLWRATFRGARRRAEELNGRAA